MKHLMIGIDPDKDKSGIAISNIKTKEIELYTLGFHDTITYLSARKDEIKEVVIEASWLVKKSSFRIKQEETKEVSYLKGKHVGWNQGVGMCLEDMIKGMGIPYRLQRPLKLVWGKNCRSKISHEEISRFVEFRRGASHIKTTNQEQRDALLLIL